MCDEDGIMERSPGVVFAEMRGKVVMKEGYFVYILFALRRRVVDNLSILVFLRLPLTVTLRCFVLFFRAHRTVLVQRREQAEAAAEKKADEEAAAKEAAAAGAGAGKSKGKVAVVKAAGQEKDADEDEVAGGDID